MFEFLFLLFFCVRGWGGTITHNSSFKIIGTNANSDLLHIHHVYMLTTNTNAHLTHNNRHEHPMSGPQMHFSVVNDKRQIENMLF